MLPASAVVVILSRLLPREGTETHFLSLTIVTSFPSKELSRLLPREGTETLPGTMPSFSACDHERSTVILSELGRCRFQRGVSYV